MKRKNLSLAMVVCVMGAAALLGPSRTLAAQELVCSDVCLPDGWDAEAYCNFLHCGFAGTDCDPDCSTGIIDHCT
jgi:hypothetical protein